MYFITNNSVAPQAELIPLLDINLSFMKPSEIQLNKTYISVSLLGDPYSRLIDHTPSLSNLCDYHNSHQKHGIHLERKLEQTNVIHTNRWSVQEFLF